jgi:hypothetical protein
MNIKTVIKYKLSQVGLFNSLALLLGTFDVIRLVNTGCVSNAPLPVKRLILSRFLYRFKLRQFIETGTHLGDTLAYIGHNKEIKCTSIELSNELFVQARKRFASYSNVNILHGDSADVLPICVLELREPALFWLDGHYSGGITAKGLYETPVSTELAAILDSSIKTHVILIDDARCFDGNNGYPNLDDLLKIVREDGHYNYAVSGDIISLTPKENK